MKVNDKVKLKVYPTGSPVEFYAYEANKDAVYEVEKIQGTDVYVKGRINYFRMSSLEIVE